jgi:hypothetical protein
MKWAGVEPVWNFSTQSFDLDTVRTSNAMHFDLKPANSELQQSLNPIL